MNFKIKLIGAGAAGNKAVIHTFEKGYVEKDNFLLINSTTKDIVDEYRNHSLIIQNADGVGKERKLGKELFMNALRSKEINIDDFLNDTSVVVLVSSLDGGTGSSVISILSKYIKDVLGIDVYIFGFNGFENDARSLSNTIEYLKELNNGYNISIISNKNCLDDSTNSMNYKKAEKIANEYFANMYKIISGITLKDSDTNIDGAELTKLLTIEGYTMISEVDLKGLESVDDFNDRIEISYRKHCQIRTNPSCKRMGVFLLTNNEIDNKIDYEFSKISETYGTAFEQFRHYQTSDENIMYIIASGMDMPLDYFKNVFEKYKDQSQKVNKTKSDFFDQLSSYEGEIGDNEYNSLSNKSDKDNMEKRKSDFFANPILD